MVRRSTSLAQIALPGLRDGVHGVVLDLRPEAGGAVITR
jgi:hypothetical protein